MLNQKNNAIVGSTGFVGGTLIKQADIEYKFNSSNIDQLTRQRYNILICSAAPAQKWIANRDPMADRKNIEKLIKALAGVKCRCFVLISTVDVFRHPVHVDEFSPVNEEGLHPYGVHRRQLEKFVQEHFPHHLIVRLPGLVGPGLRKNVIFDLLNNHNLDAIESRGVFQFYPMVNLWYDIQTALSKGLKLVHLTAQPISVSDVSRQGFGRQFEHVVSGQPAHYDMQTCYAESFGAAGRYQYALRESLQAIRAYAQSEPMTLLS